MGCLTSCMTAVLLIVNLRIPSFSASSAKEISEAIHTVGNSLDDEDRLAFAYASEQVLKRRIHSLALRAVLDHRDWDASLGFASTLLPGNALEGTQLAFLSLLKSLAKGATSTDELLEQVYSPRINAHERSPSNAPPPRRCLSNGRASTEAAAASAVAGLPQATAQGELRAWLARDYNFEVLPDNASVQISINFFKIVDIDKRNSLMTLSVWLRLRWHDHRLRFNSSLWGTRQLAFQAEPNSLENSRIWLPDVELYNSEQSIQQTLSTEPAIVYADGMVLWSRPGTLHVLCSFQGMEKFPLDELFCTLEFGAWVYTLDSQDIVLRKMDGGYVFAGKTVSGTSIQQDGYGTSETAGGTFQEFEIVDITPHRTEKIYDCCPDAYPQIFYTIQIRRGKEFYIMKLIVPQVSLALLSLITYFMSAEVGERLGFGITLVLAVLASDIVATEFMPVCQDTLLMSYITFACLAFCVVALVESSVVLGLHHLEYIDVQEVLPTWMRCKRFRTRHAVLEDIMGTLKFSVGPSTGTVGRLFRSMSRVSSIDSEASGTSEGHPPDVYEPEGGQVVPTSPDAAISALNFCPEASTRTVSEAAAETPKSPGQQIDYSSLATDQCDIRMRTQLYREAFYILDEDFSGKLERGEVDTFGHFMMGDDWNQDYLDTFMRRADVDGSGGLCLKEFSSFCESVIVNSEQAKEFSYLREMIKGFIAVTKTLQESMKMKWKRRAKRVDSAFRKIVPCLMFIAFSICVAKARG